MRSEIAEHRTSFNRRRRAPDEHRRRPPPSSEFRSPFKIVDAGPASIASFNRFLHVLSSSGVQRFLVSISGVDFYMSFAIQDEGELLSRLRKDDRQKMRRREGLPPLPSTTIDEANSRLPTSDSGYNARFKFNVLIQIILNQNRDKWKRHGQMEDRRWTNGIFIQRRVTLVVFHTFKNCVYGGAINLESIIMIQYWYFASI
ncbi:hypothetical protein LXL04_001879 [Taraxacum kok-saghyz]